MARPTTIRIPEGLIKEIDEVVEKLKLDRSTYLRDILWKGFTVDQQDRILRNLPVES
jgi:metal-responsive CopG/Arc/MetJ family transcriptional regulator